MTPQQTAVLFSMGSCLSTGAGGLLALKFKDQLKLLLGFSAGALVAVPLFDLLPVVFAQPAVGERAMVATALGFLSLFLLERYTSFHKVRDSRVSAAERSAQLGNLSAGGLAIHSFLDGLAIGVGFDASAYLGFAIAVAVILHDMSDGLNTVTVVLAHGSPIRRSVIWLIIDMIAPVLGALSTFFFHFPATVIPWLLAYFAGFFLYLGASDLLPEARVSKSPIVAVATVVGMSLVYVVTQVLPE